MLERSLFFKTLALMGLFFINWSCQKDEVQLIMPAEKSYAGVEQPLWIYFERFEEEAAERGLKIDLNAERIKGKIEAIDEVNVAGICHFNAHQPNDLVIDRQFWIRASDLSREFIVFHELGHCSLFRDHREDAYQNGLCKSIMRSGLGDCRDQYNIYTRADYLNELFLLQDNLD